MLLFGLCVGEVMGGRRMVERSLKNLGSVASKGGVERVERDANRPGSIKHGDR